MGLRVSSPARRRPSAVDSGGRTRPSRPIRCRTWAARRSPRRMAPTVLADRPETSAMARSDRCGLGADDLGGGGLAVGQGQRQAV